MTKEHNIVIGRTEQHRHPLFPPRLIVVCVAALHATFVRTAIVRGVIVRVTIVRARPLRPGGITIPDALPD